MYAVAETYNFDADLAARDIPARIGKPWEVAAKAVPWAVEQRPYDGPALAGTSNAQPACSELPTRIVNASLESPGQQDQQWVLKEDFPACANTDANGVAIDSIKRLVQIKTQFKRRGRWITTSQPPWNQTLFVVDTPEQSRQAQIATQVIGTGHEKKARCGDKARVKIRVQAVDTANGNKLQGQQVGTYRVAMAGTPCH